MSAAQCAIAVASNLPALTDQQLDTVRELAAEGNREHVIRRTLGLTPSQWRRLKDDPTEGDLSPLTLALEEGRAEGATNLIAFFKTRMAGGDPDAAKWLAANVFKIGKEDGNGEGNQPRVTIILNAAMASVEAFNALPPLGHSTNHG